MTESGKYVITASNECNTVQSEIDVTFVGLDKDAIPNVITPNGDLQNQYFYIPADKTEARSLEILNRWGRRVYLSTDYRDNWDAEGLPTGVYFYRLVDACAGEIKGTVSVLR